MFPSAYGPQHAACAYFFLCPGLAYGILTSRMPALKEQTGANEAQIGLLLFCIGLSSLVALLCSGRIISRWSSRTVLRTGSLMLLLAVIVAALAPDPLLLGAAFIPAGLGMGMTDVAMNTQGIQLECRYRRPCMAFMHAAYSLGGVAGALGGALFAALNLGAFINAACVLGLYACLRPWAMPRLMDDMPPADNTPQKGASPVPLFVVLCGVGAMFAYVAEGSVAEWGSLLLFTVKGAEESTVACAFAVFSAATVCCRLFGDGLRRRRPDSSIVFFGGLLATVGMALVLFCKSPLLCLAGYACMGAGLSPIVPILFSRAGTCPGVSPSQASAAVSVLSYGGMLLFPPMLGFLAHDYGLEKSLSTIFLVCLVLTAGSVVLRKTQRKRAR
ncbi:MFS transporter [Mailhella massiliensis]|uniref:MFS transporter n=1 Tax=Mailhella massiliensis TaxID=1903261 RepID=UPI00097D43CB|nr:MFS transporter [Mailhella massiliensis]